MTKLYNNYILHDILRCSLCILPHLDATSFSSSVLKIKAVSASQIFVSSYQITWYHFREATFLPMGYVHCLWLCVQFLVILKAPLCVSYAYACAQRILPYFSTALYTQNFIPSFADALKILNFCRRLAERLLWSQYLLIILFKNLTFYCVAWRQYI
jgi:hypothetical protein